MNIYLTRIMTSLSRCLVILLLTLTLHYGKQGGHYPHVLQRPFILMASEVFLKGKWVKYIFRNVKTHLNMSSKLLILAPEMNIRLVALNFS